VVTACPKSTNWRATIPAESGATPVAVDVVDAFNETSSANASRPAIVHNGRSLTYAHLHQQAREVAHRLGPRPGPVGVLATHRPATVVSMFGVLMAGGTYCPIDPAFPPQRREAMAAAIGWREVLDGTAENGSFDRPIEPDSRSVTNIPVDPDQPAYALFTSGSTGSPKPVLTPRRAISVVTAALRDVFDLSPADRVLQFASLNWDTCFEEILPTLTTGATLVFDDEAYTGSLPRFLRMVEQQDITVMDLPTAFWHEVVRYLAEDDLSLPDCVRLLVIGGEAVSPARLTDWTRLKTSSVRLLNTYGCTETTLITHAIDLHGPAADRDSNGDSADGVPIGKALPHVVEHITADGELLIGGPALASGYGGEPAVTAERFVDLDGARFFHTRDRVRKAADGVLVHHGRLDHEVKVRGIRVDPGEVEARVAEHPAVNAVAVVGVTVAGRTTLVAYVVAKPAADGDRLATDLTEFLRARVPGHLVPGRITVVPELVYTASGKVDRAGSHQRHMGPMTG
jgi:nonribosomal peptide synthetase protein VioO